MPESKRTDWFTIKKRNYKGIAFLVFVLIVIVFCVIFYAYKNQVVNTKTLDKDKISEFTIFILSFIIGLLGNFVASIFWDVVVKDFFKKDIDNKLLDIASLTGEADRDILYDIFEDLEGYKNTFYHDYKIKAVLGLCSERFFKCTISKSYKKTKVERHLKFRFIRIRNDEDAKKPNDQSSCEYEYKSEERSFRESSLEPYYLVKWVKVASSSLNASTQLNQPTPVAIDNIKEYIYVIPDEYLLQDDVEISYDIEFLIEKDSYLFFGVDLPSKGIECILDYENVKEQAEFFAKPFINSGKLMSINDSMNVPRKHFELRNSWVLPKSVFFFVWYKRG